MLLYLVYLLVVLSGLYFLLSFTSRIQNEHLRRNGIPVFHIAPLWYKFYTSLLPKNQEFNRHVTSYHYLQGKNRLFDKERISAVTLAGKVIVHIYKPEFLEVIMNSTSLINKSWGYNLLTPWLGNGLLISNGDKWRERRKLLTPAFHFKILERFIPVFDHHSIIFVRKIMERLDEPFVDVVPLMSLCTLDIIGETAMGVELRSQEFEDSEYVKAICRIEILFTSRLIQPWLWPDIVFWLSPTGRDFKRTLSTIHSFTRKVVSEKKKELKEQLLRSQNEEQDEVDPENLYLQTKKRRAFLDLLLYHHLTDGKITEEDIREEVDTFMFEGHDTTAMGVSWALYNIGLYPTVQKQVHEELDSIFGNDLERKITPEDLKELRYLECVLKESLRVYPSVPFIGREQGEETVINGMKFPKGSIFSLDIISVHRDPEAFPNPEQFNPERFFPENASRRKNFTYIPFSAGPRNCIGQRFAMMEEKAVVANILRHFRIISLDPPDKVIDCGEMVLRPLNGIRLKFNRR